MKRALCRALAVFFVAALLLGAMTLPSAAEPRQSSPTEQRATEAIEKILAGELAAAGADSVQAWLDGDLSLRAGGGAEWFVIALRQSGKAYDFSAYRLALATYLQALSSDPGATTRQRYALAFLACGGGDTYIQTTVDTSIGQLGHMSLVFGLHLLNHGYSSDDTTVEQVVELLLERQLADGGWALSGEVSNVDVTAMTLQALAPHTHNERVSVAVEKALGALSSMQLSTGDFSSYGVPNPESGAQVIVALTSLGMSVDDERFQKNGATLLDGLLRYQLPDGRFCHEQGGEYNTTATMQALYALVSVTRDAPLYSFEPIEGVPDLTAPGALPTPEQPSDASDGIDARIYLAAGVAALGLVACLILFLKGKRKPKQYLSVLLVVVLLLGVLALLDIRSTEEYYGKETAKKTPIGSVTLTIRCDTVVGKSDAAHIPADGVILKTSSFEIEQGDTVFDILAEATAKYELHMEASGVTGASSALAYIRGIGYLYEFDFGDLSGWVYHVNGDEPSVGCGEYVLSDGDEIEFHYTCNLGDDLN